MAHQSVCFVDDDPLELRRFKKVFSERFDIGIGHSTSEALRDLDPSGTRKPDLFLLDMYIPDGPLPSESELAQLHKAREKFLKAQAEFRSFLAKIGQTSEGGFKIARALARTSRVPYCFFTRKAVLEDAIAAYEDVHALSVIKKPDPSPFLFTTSPDLQDAYDKALEQSFGLVAGQIERAIARSSWWGRHGKTVIGFLLGVAASLVAATVWWLGAAALGSAR